jgi:hypothetical protein
MSESTFQPSYHHVELALPPDARTPEERALKAFARKCRCDRIRANIAKSPSRSMFYREDVAA